MTTDTLYCACCCGRLDEADATPAPDGVTMRYHRDIADCWRVRKQRAMAWHPSKHGINNPPYVVETPPATERDGPQGRSS